MSALGSLSFDVSRDLDRAFDLGDVQNIFSKSIASVGLTCSACGMVTGALSTKTLPFYFTNWPSDWRDFYERSGFVAFDPLVRFAIKSGRASTWTEVKQSLPPNDPGHQIYAAAARWGLVEGMAISFRNHSGDIGLITMGGNRKPFSPEEIDYLQLVSTSTFRNCQRIDAGDNVDRPALFTQREEECMELLRVGMADAEIGRVLGVGTTTVVTHLENARRKINAKSRTHLVALTNHMVRSRRGV